MYRRAWDFGELGFSTCASIICVYLKSTLSHLASPQALVKAKDIEYKWLQNNDLSKDVFFFLIFLNRKEQFGQYSTLYAYVGQFQFASLLHFA